ncbi:hypothetical protein MAP00_006608 [Monascus purpureus]|nr:hypothetical protein MAP00_006608 [Monascus purpureus]
MVVSIVWFATKMRLQTCPIIPFTQAGQELKTEHPMRRKEYNGKENRLGTNETRTKKSLREKDDDILLAFALDRDLGNDSKGLMSCTIWIWDSEMVWVGSLKMTCAVIFFGHAISGTSCIRDASLHITHTF